LALLLAAAALLTASCGNGRKPVYPVRGQVFDKHNKAAAGAMIVFHPADGGDDPHKPIATTNAEGQFTLTTYTEGDGAPEGDYEISVRWPAPKKSPFDAETGDQLKGALADPKKSGLRFKVEKGDNEVPTIRLP
jgi:hypothetical protein